MYVFVVSGMCKERPAVAGVTWCLAAPTMDQTGLHPGSISFAWKCARVLAQSPKSRIAKAKAKANAGRKPIVFCLANKICKAQIYEKLN